MSGEKDGIREQQWLIGGLEENDGEENDGDEDVDEDQDALEGGEGEEITKKDREKPPRWLDRLATALSIATPRSFAAAELFRTSPNPLLIVRSSGLNSGINNSNLESGDKPPVCLGFPLSRSHVEGLQNQNYIMPDEKIGLDTIPSKFLVFRNQAFTSWVREKAENLSKKLGIEGVEIELDFAFMLHGEQRVSGFGNG